jgi:hypothetical protein
MCTSLTQHRNRTLQNMIQTERLLQGRHGDKVRADRTAARPSHAHVGPQVDWNFVVGVLFQGPHGEALYQASWLELRTRQPPGTAVSSALRTNAQIFESATVDGRPVESGTWRKIGLRELVAQRRGPVSPLVPP